MKILLISPSSVVSERWVDHAQPFLPIGLGSLAAVLRQQGHDVAIIDGRTEGWQLRGRLEGGWVEIGLTEEEIAARIRQFRPQVVGFSLPFTTQMPRLRSLARWVKTIHPEIFIVCGGNHSTAAPHDVLNIPEVDAVVLGEGELTLSRLIDKLATGNSFERINGIAFRDIQGHVQINQQKEYLQNLNELPIPAYDLLPLMAYFDSIGRRTAPLFVSRGCDGTCSHCSSHLIFGTKSRSYSPGYVVKQIKYLVENYGIHDFSFDDDALFTDQDAAEKIFAAIISENLKIQWTARSGRQYDVLDEVFLNSIKLAGAKRLYYAPESGSRRVLRRILKKSSDLFALEQAILRTLKAGIKVSCNFTLGLPGETIEEVYETLNYAWKLRKLGVDEFTFSLATPYVGTGLRIMAERAGCLINLPESMYTPHESCLTTDEFSAPEIVDIRDTAEKEFNTRNSLFGKNRCANAQKTRFEDRYFFSVAPQASYLKTPSTDHSPLQLAQEAV